MNKTFNDGNNNNNIITIKGKYNIKLRFEI